MTNATTHNQSDAPRVELFALRSGAPAHVATASLVGGRAVWTGEPDVVAAVSGPFAHPTTGTELREEDGFAYLAALASLHDSPYLYATGVIEA